MGLSTEQLLTSTRYFLDLHDVPSMSPAQRTELLDTYKAEVTDLAAQEQQAIERVRQQEPHMPAMSTMRALSRVARKHRAAQRALARIEKAITQAEIPQRIDGLTF